jgi:predicted lipoprotein
MTRLRFVTLLGALIWAAPAAADQVQIAVQLTDRIAIPRFQTMADETAQQEQVWKTFCAAPRRGDPNALRAAYQKVSDAWAAVEYFRIGPEARELRADRFNFWLDRTNATGKALTALLAAPDTSALAPDQLAQGSVAEQGLPMLERLLYDDGAVDALRAGDAQGARRCAIGVAVSHNLATIAGQIYAGWTAPDSPRAAILGNKPFGRVFGDAKQAAAIMLTDDVGGLELLFDKKVPYLFHDAANPAAIKLAQDVRSGRSLRDIRLNLATLRDETEIFLADAALPQRKALDDAFAAAAAGLDSMEATEGSNVDQKTRLAAINDAIAAFGKLRDTTMIVLPAATGLSVGFNNLDGD